MAEFMTVTLAANETETFRKGGAYIEVIESAFPVDIAFSDSNGGSTSAIKGALSGFFLGVEYGAFTVKNGAIPQVIQILVLDPGESGGSRRQPGNVRIIDSSADKTAAGLQFLGSGSSAAVVGQGSMIGVQAVGKTVSLKNIVLSSSVAGTVLLMFSTGDPTLTPNPTPNFGFNKLATGANSTAKAVRGNSVGTSPTAGELPGVRNVVGYTLSANVPFIVPITTPIQLPSGTGLIVSGYALNRDILVAFDFEES